MSRVGTRMAWAALIVIAGWVLPAAAAAETITVDTNEGSVNSNGTCSLPEAVKAANSDQAVDGCPAGNGTDRIAFDISGSTVIPLAQQLPDVKKPVKIDGTTEPDFADVPIVDVDNGGGVVTGIEPTTPGVVIKGLAFTDFIGEGVRASTGGTKIAGNLIGLDTAGNDHGNGIGVSLEGDGNTVGGAQPAARNVISGNNLGGGVFASGEANRIVGNYIGVKGNGSSPLSNDGNGITVTGARTEIVDNVISASSQAGVQVDGRKAHLTANLIGTNASGTGAIPNNVGVLVRGMRSTIGGDGPQDRNVISGNTTDGLRITTGGVGPTRRNVVTGNYIGTDVAGTAQRANGGDGVEIFGSDNNRIGGNAPGEANVISGNIVGVRIGGGDVASGNVVGGNLIGTDPSGKLDLGNESGAVRLSNEAQDNTVGGLEKGEGNLMRFTPGGAVSIGGGITAFGNSILGNSAYDNGEEVIDLAENGVTPNDLGSPPDTDTGPNNLQNFPDLIGGDELDDRIFGSLDSSPDARFRIEFFASDQPDDAQRYVGAREITTNEEGHRNFVFQSSKNLPAGDFVTATATLLDGDDPGDTSELSDQADISVGP